MVAILKTTQIQEPSSATVNLTLDTLGNASFAGMPYGASSFLRNRIINGDMRIDQRNAGAAQTITTASAYTVDRWLSIPAGASVTGQRSSGTLSQYNYRFTGAASVTQIQFQQRIESVNIADLAGKTVTVSVNLSNSLLTSVGWQVWNANTVDNFAGITLISSGSITVSSTETNYTFSVTLPAGAANGVMLNFFVGAQTSGTWTIGNVQLEQGSVATPFERRLYGQELALCQRYYQKWGGDTGYERIGLGQAYSTTQANINVSMLTPMRTTPSFSTVGNLALTGTANATLAATAVANDSSSSQLINLVVSVASGLTDGRATQFCTNNSTAARFQASAEL